MGREFFVAHFQAETTTTSVFPDFFVMNAAVAGNGRLVPEATVVILNGLKLLEFNDLNSRRKDKRL
jgi:hypothetical protein